MAEEQSKSCLKVVVGVGLIGLLSCVVLSAGVYLTWEGWGKEKWAELKAQTGTEAEEAEPSGSIEELPLVKQPRPVVARAPINADERVLGSYLPREDVLVMVEYYSDT